MKYLTSAVCDVAILTFCWNTIKNGEHTPPLIIGMVSNRNFSKSNVVGL